MGAGKAQGRLTSWQVAITWSSRGRRHCESLGAGHLLSREHSNPEERSMKRLG